MSDHGKLTEVSKAAFTYSRIHCFSLFITHAMGAICALGCYTPKQSRRTK